MRQVRVALPPGVDVVEADVTMRHARAFGLVGLALMVWGGGCGGGSGSESFIGVYEVSSHRMNVPAGGGPISRGDAGEEVTGREPFIAFVVPPFVEDSDAWT